MSTRPFGLSDSVLTRNPLDTALGGGVAGWAKDRHLPTLTGLGSAPHESVTRVQGQGLGDGRGTIRAGSLWVGVVEDGHGRVWRANAEYAQPHLESLREGVMLARQWRPSVARPASRVRVPQRACVRLKQRRAARR